MTEDMIEQMRNEQPSRPLLNIGDFNAACAAHVKRLVIGMAISFPSLLFLIGAFGFFKNDLLKWSRLHFEPAYADAMPALMLNAAAVIGVAIFLGVMCVLLLRTQRDPRHLCPHCGKPLVHLQALVIATRNCGLCGWRALADPEVKGGGEAC